MPAPRKKKDWATRAELRNAVIAVCETEFARRHGVAWEPSWSAALRQDYEMELELDRRAGPVLSELREALVRAGQFLHDSGIGTKNFYLTGFDDDAPRDDTREVVGGRFRRHVGRVAGALRDWFSEFLHGEVFLPEAPDRTPQSFRVYIGGRWSMGATEIGEGLPNGLDEVAERRPLLSLHELAVITVLCGCFPQMPNKLPRITVGQVIDREKKALRRAPGHTKDGSERELAPTLRRFGIAVSFGDTEGHAGGKKGTSGRSRRRSSGEGRRGLRET